MLLNETISENFKNWRMETWSRLSKLTYVAANPKPAERQ